MRAIIIAICVVTWCATPAAAQSPSIGPITLGMSPSELAAVASDAVSAPVAERSGASAVSGTVQLYNAPFSMRAQFYWNTGLHGLSLQHSSQEDEQTCAAIVDASRLDIERAFDAAPTFNREQADRWNGWWSAQASPERPWSVAWSGGWTQRAAGGARWCTVSLYVSGPPPPTPDPMIVDFALAEPLAGPPVWLAQPTPAEVQALHPQRAAVREVGGVVSLACRVRAVSGALECRVRDDRPPGYGFGEAALRVSELYRIAPEAGGAPTLGRKFELVVDFTNVPSREQILQQ